MRKALLGVTIGVALLLMLDAVAARLGLAPGLRPDVGGAAWITSRAAGVTAFAALTLELAFGLLVSTGAADRLLPRAKTVELHRWLSSVTVALIVVHAMVLLADKFVRFDVFDVLVPLLSPYRPVAVGLGVLAAYAALLVHVSFWLRRRLGAKTWRKLHYLSFAVFVAALAHGALAGSDSSSDAMRALYLGSATLIAALTLYRVSARPGPRRTERVVRHAS